jgi:hypothetical protein
MSATARSFGRGGLLASLLLVLVVLGFLGHIVPLPFSGHTPFTTSTGSHGPSDGGSEASHVASCDATIARTAPTLPAPAATIAVTPKSVAFVSCAHPTASLAVAAQWSRHHTGAPLFLLHASFLI